MIPHGGAEADLFPSPEAAALVVANLDENRTNPRSRAAFVMYWCIFVAFLGACASEWAD